MEPVRSTRLVEIRVEDTDPKLAAEMANALANAYVHQNLELKFSAARDALTWLTAQVQDLKSKVNESELTLQRYREQAGLVSAEEKQSLTNKKLARVQQRLHRGEGQAPRDGDATGGAAALVSAGRRRWSPLRS